MPVKDIRKQYFWDPFPYHIDVAMNTTKSKYQAKSNCTILPNVIGSNGLSHIENYATLIIDGHGTKGDPHRLSADFKEVVWPDHKEILTIAVDYKKLAELISDIGRLPKSHQKIRLMGCWGAGFARLLAIELGQKEYHSIKVAGYKASVKVGVFDSKTGRGPNPTISYNEDGEELIYSKDRIAWYNSSGNEVAKPDVGAEAIVGTSNSEWN